MPADRFGLPVTTDSPAALARYDAGIDELLGWRRAALDSFRAAIAADPGLALAHAGAAVCLFLDEDFAGARAAADAARAAVAGQTPREEAHVEALALFVGGKAADAEARMAAHLERHPRDLAIFQRLYFIWFWQGRFPEMLAATTRLRARVDDGLYLGGLHAFALEQADRLPEALAEAERAIAENPRDAWAIHAFAHTLYEWAKFDEGIRRLPPAIHPCTELSWFRDHLLWHLALLHLSAGHYERVQALSRRVFERAPNRVAGELHDSIALLWRLDLCGQPPGPRWQRFAGIARSRLDRQGLPFHSAHLAMALAAGGDWASAERQLQGLRDRAPRDPAGVVGAVLVPLIEGLHAFAAGDHRRAVERIEPTRPRLVELGGSRAQRDVFHDTMIEACLRGGDPERAGELIAERVRRRPDRLWVARRVRAATAA
jgi:tetratricopeptide (TPR) repeat protein